MNLNKNNFSIYFLLLSFFMTFSQENTTQKDSLGSETLDEVVVKGENRVMSLSKKLFTVNVIKRADIEKLAANNLADMLNFNLNVSIVPDASTGRSTVNMFGLSGEYVKVLIDGIPISSDNGLGNNIDIEQINLEDVERVEVVEGAMGVLYGDNAVAGVINVVTKKNFKNDLSITASVQEETVGNEYLLFDKGRHIQNLKLTTNKIDNLNLSVGISRNDFGGYFNDYGGKNYARFVGGLLDNNGLRGTEWNPKNQLTLFGNVHYQLKGHNIFYKLQYYNEVIDIYNRNIISRLANNQATAKAIDEQYDTDRLLNNINIYGSLFEGIPYNFSFSYQTQKRYYKEYTYNILQRDIESYQIDRLNQSSTNWYSKGYLSNLLSNTNFLKIQAGYEFDGQKGFDAIATGAYSNDDVENKLNNYNFFTTLDFEVSDKLSLYPGLRFVNNSQFGSKLIWQIATNYTFKNTYKAKFNFGSAFKTPSFSQLFFYFVDANHNVQGNPNLQPEDGISMMLNLDKTFLFESEGVLKSAVKSYFFDIEDKIQTINTVDDNDRNLATFGNVGNQKIIGFSLNNNFTYKKWNVSLGANYLGESIRLYESNQANSDYLWNLNLTSNLRYTIPKIKTSASINLKYNGVRQAILRQDNDELLIGKTDAFTLLDASIKTKLFKNFEFTLGSRNILDVVNINQTATTGNHGGNTNVPRLIGYGRSYYLKLLYNLNLN